MNFQLSVNPSKEMGEHMRQRKNIIRPTLRWELNPQPMNLINHCPPTELQVHFLNYLSQKLYLVQHRRSIGYEPDLLI